MLSRKLPILLALFALIFPLLNGSALANKSAVAIQAPTTAQKGSEVVIQLRVTHDGNSFIHYTEWVYIMINGKETARWDYTASQRPESDAFTKEIKFTATDNLEIKAEASCNLHGSAGPATATVLLKD